MQTRRTTAAALSALLLAAPRLVSGQESQVQGGVVGRVSKEDKEWAKGWDVVNDYDQPPKPIKIAQPRYPQAAFSHRVEGTVVLEIVMDSEGRVPLSRVFKSIPGLDAAAIRCVKTWRFEPAQKDGHPVATVGRAPVSFRILDALATSARVGPLRFDPLGADFTQCVERLMAEIREHWAVSKIPAPEPGDHVDVEFVVERDGAVSDVRILRASSLPALDKAAVAAVRRSRPLPLPVDYPDPRVTMQVSFSFGEGEAPAPDNP